MAVAKCNRCGKGSPSFAGYWEDNRGKFHYWYACDVCDAGFAIECASAWDREHPSVIKQLGPPPKATYEDNTAFVNGIWVNV